MTESLEETARRTCDFEETAMAGVEMVNDPEIIAAINTKRFDRIELLGLLVDILQDYADGDGWTLKGSEELRAAIEVLKDIYGGKI